MKHQSILTVVLAALLATVACKPSSSEPSSRALGVDAAPAHVVTDAERYAACMSPTGWRCSSPEITPKAAGGVRPPVHPPTWNVTQWHVNKSTGNNNNDCLTSGTACQTKEEIVAGRWGCVGHPKGCPILQQVTTFTGDASDTDDTDPGYFLPTLTTSGALIVNMPLPASPDHTGTVTSVFTGQRNLTTQNAIYRFTDGTANNFMPQGTFLVSPGNVSGTPWAVWSHSQVNNTVARITHPFTQETTFPNTTISVPELQPAVNDTYSTYTSILAMNIAVLDPVIESAGDAGSAAQQSNQIFLSRLSIFDPNGPGVDTVVWGQHVSGYEIDVKRTIDLRTSGQTIDTVCNNCQIEGGLTGGRNTTGTFFRLNGGQVFPSLAQQPNIQGPGIALSGDILVRNNMTFVSGASLELVYLDTGVVLNLGGFSTLSLLANGYTAANTTPAIVNGSVLYGPGHYNGLGNGSFGLDPQDGGAPGQNQLVVAGNTLNGSTTGCCLSGSTIFCGVGVNAIAVDTACTDAGLGCGGPGGNSSCFSPSFGGANIRTNLQ